MGCEDAGVLAYYGDPKWDVRMQEVPGETDFTVTSSFRKADPGKDGGASRKCVITIETSPSFSLRRMQGDGFKQEHVLDLPFSYFNIVVDENFLLMYSPDFKPGMKYTVEVLCD